MNAIQFLLEAVFTFKKYFLKIELFLKKNVEMWPSGFKLLNLLFASIILPSRHWVGVSSSRRESTWLLIHLKLSFSLRLKRLWPLVSWFIFLSLISYVLIICGHPTGMFQSFCSRWLHQHHYFAEKFLPQKK